MSSTESFGGTPNAAPETGAVPKVSLVRAHQHQRNRSVIEADQQPVVIDLALKLSFLARLIGDSQIIIVARSLPTSLADQPKVGGKSDDVCLSSGGWARAGC